MVKIDMLARHQPGWGVIAFVQKGTEDFSEFHDRRRFVSAVAGWERTREGAL